jgi:predicted esterase
MNETYLVAQPVAVKWSPLQKITWPTKGDPFKKQKFTTEEFVDVVIQDVSARHTIDERFVFTLSWSSGGPAAYSIALDVKSRVTGSYVAMSVFRPEWHPHVDRAKGHAFLIDHSPQDKVCKFEFAEKAQRELTAAGGQVRLVTYDGGHGWHGNMYGRVAEGMKWLVEQTEKH